MRRMFAGWLCLSLISIASAADWPQYKGPRRDDISTETGLLSKWPNGGPSLLWTYKNAGVGYSGMAVVGDRLFTIGGRGDTEFVIAVDTKTIRDGSVSDAWATSVGRLFDFPSNNWSAGPSATPTVDGELVFALGGNGDLVCVQAADGKERWRKNLPSELDAQVNPIGGGPKNLGWGFTWSPLVDGDKLICVPGGPKGTLAALDKKSGDVLWRSSEVKDQAAYTSPAVAEIDGVRQYVVLTNFGVFGVDAKDGRVLWNHRRERPYGTEVVNSPIVRGSLVYTTVGAGQTCDLLRIERDGDRFKAAPVWSNRNMLNHHGNVVLIGDHVFGASDGRGWTCQSFATGETVWMERAKLPPGSVTVADGRLYCFSEGDGTTALVDASTSGWKESGRFRIPERSASRKPSGQIWTPPVVSGGKLFLRDQEFVFCFDVKSLE